MKPLSEKNQPTASPMKDRHPGAPEKSAGSRANLGARHLLILGTGVFFFIPTAHSLVNVPANFRPSLVSGSLRTITVDGTAIKQASLALISQPAPAGTWYEWTLHRNPAKTARPNYGPLEPAEDSNPEPVPEPQ